MSSKVRPPTRRLGSSLEARIVVQGKAYALLGYGKSQVLVSISFRFNKYEFDVLRSTELSIHIYLGNPTTQRGSPRLPLAETVSLGPFDGRAVSGWQWAALQNHAGRVRISLEYERSTDGLLFGPSIKSHFLLTEVVGRRSPIMSEEGHGSRVRHQEGRGGRGSRGPPDPPPLRRPSAVYRLVVAGGLRGVDRAVHSRGPRP